MMRSSLSLLKDTVENVYLCPLRGKATDISLIPLIKYLLREDNTWVASVRIRRPWHVSRCRRLTDVSLHLIQYADKRGRMRLQRRECACACPVEIKYNAGCLRSVEGSTTCAIRHAARRFERSAERSRPMTADLARAMAEKGQEKRPRMRRNKKARTPQKSNHQISAFANQSLFDVVSRRRDTSASYYESKKTQDLRQRGGPEANMMKREGLRAVGTRLSAQRNMPGFPHACAG